MILNETYTLGNGVKIPRLGLGTWFIPDGEAAEAVRQAASIGYRLFDTAQAYGNEAGVGAGVRSCSVSREQLFVTSKVAAEHKTYESAAKSIDETLERMGLDYLDLMIIHSPQPWNDFRGGDYAQGNREAWRALEDAFEAGKLRAIGVSNFRRADLENILSGCRIKPMVNQILLHISNTDLALLEYCREQGILTEAYSPIAHGEALRNPQIAAMAEKYGVSPAALCIRYVLELGAVALPKTANPEHMRANAAVDFSITPEDMESLKRMERIENYGEFSRFPVFSGK
ncbi:MAG: aldo/keto reductase [Eubacteriales bacterium]|nr:aldo/keto reductase [Eubacteriales bacterium]